MGLGRSLPKNCLRRGIYGKTISTMIRQGKTARPALKICGVTNARDLAYCVSLGVEYVGLNLAPRSKRHLTTGEAARVVADAGYAAASGTRLVAVFVDPSDAEVDEAVTA